MDLNARPYIRRRYLHQALSLTPLTLVVLSTAAVLLFTVIFVKKAQNIGVNVYDAAVHTIHISLCVSVIFRPPRPTD